MHVIIEALRWRFGHLIVYTSVDDLFKNQLFCCDAVLWLPWVIVVGLSFNTDEGSLRDAFSHYGEIIDGMQFLNFLCAHLGLLFWYWFLVFVFVLFFPAKIIVDRDTGRSRGFGFITYAAEEQASSAIMALDGKVKS